MNEPSSSPRPLRFHPTAVERRFVWLAWALAGCATTPPAPPPAPPDPTPAERACVATFARTRALLISPALTACRWDLDCREVSPLVAGGCGLFVSTAGFESHRAAFEAQRLECDDVTQVVPPCPRARGACIAGQCTNEAVSSIPEACEELGAELDRQAAAANSCTSDGQCVALAGDRATNLAFLETSARERDALARACGVVLEPLFGSAEAPTAAFCVAGRCQNERKFQTTVHDSARTHSVEITSQQRACLWRELASAFTDPSVIRRTGSLVSFKVTIDQQGRMNQFQFKEPRNLHPALQAAIASRLRDCPVGPVKDRRGRPATVRWTITLISD